MKKFLIIPCLVLILTGCNNSNNQINFKNDSKMDVNIETYQDDNPIKIGLYDGFDLVDTFTATKKNHTEIGVFNIYYTNIPKLDSQNIKYNYSKYYNMYESIDKYKVGFYISFMIEDELIEKVALDPTAKHSMTPYLYIYLYDDIHQPDGAWYSHLEPEDMQENTVYSSIKLYLAEYGASITSPISVTVFSYKDESDFDQDGFYIGNSKHTITINLK